jgi:CDP-glycerol glycerophosphotransferase (TagB/SpsB family)
MSWSAGELAEHFTIAKPTLSGHFAVLKTADLVTTERQGTTIIQTWHACGAFKKVGYSLVDKSFGADEELTRRVRIHSNYDVCLVASKASAPHYAEAFGQPLERFESRFGIPRTDVFFGEERLARTRDAVRRRQPCSKNWVVTKSSSPLGSAYSRPLRPPRHRFLGRSKLWNFRWYWCSIAAR